MWRRRCTRGACWLTGTIGFAAVGLLLLGAIGPRAFGVGRLGFSNGRGTTGLVWATSPLQATWPGNSDWPHWKLDPGMTILLAWDLDGPSRRLARSTVSTGGGPPLARDLTGIWIPTWWMAVGGLLLCLVLRRVLRTMSPRGACPACRYDLRGLPGSRCPECGGELAPLTHTPLREALPTGSCS